MPTCEETGYSIITPEEQEALHKFVKAEQQMGWPFQRFLNHDPEMAVAALQVALKMYTPNPSPELGLICVLTTLAVELPTRDDGDTEYN